MTDDRSQNNNRDKKEDETFSGAVVNGFRSCRDLSDIVPLYSPRGLYLKPVAKIFVSVNLPQLKIPGKTISTWEVMEKIRILIRPDEFAALKVVKSTLEFIRLEGDLTDKCRLQMVLARLDSQRLNLAGFANVLKVRATEAKDEFPTRHSWDSYFRDAKHMNELKPGERPDTIHISGLPVKWFSEDGGATPSESLVTKIFKKWGTLRRVDVPAADAYRSRMRLGPKNTKFSFEDGLFFDAYVQYIEYMDFVKAMDDLRGMKILKKEQQNYLSAALKVDFDKTKHMSDSSVAYREFERKRLINQDSLAAEKMKRKEEAEAKREEELKKKEETELKAQSFRRQTREEKRRRKALTVFRKQEEDKVSLKIAREERKLIRAQRQLESIRLLDELFDRIKTKVERKEIDINTLVNVDKDDKSVKKSVTEDSKEVLSSLKKKDKKEKKTKKKKYKKDKNKKKKNSKDKNLDTDESSNESNKDRKKKLKSVLNKATVGEQDAALPYSDMYPRIPHWYYDAATLPVLYPPVGKGNFRGGRFSRGRGRGRGWRGDFPRVNRQFNPHIYNEQYYKYFASLAGQEYHSFDSDYESPDSRSKSQRRSRSKSRKRTRSRSRSKSRRRKRSGSRSRTRSKSRSSRSKSASVSKSRSKKQKRSSSRSQSKSKDKKSRSRSRTRSKSKTTEGNKSHSKRASRKSRSRSPRRSDSRYKPKTASYGKNRRGRARSKVRITSARSRSTSRKRSRSSSSWSLPKSPRQRSCSWSKSADAVKSAVEKLEVKETKVADPTSENAPTAKLVSPT